MSGEFSNVIVGCIVLGAALYSVWRLGPALMRQWILSRLSRAFPSLAGRSAKSGCEACGNCAPSPPKTSSPLHFVPPSKLRR
jgi:hypothetical protein